MIVDPPEKPRKERAGETGRDLSAGHRDRSADRDAGPPPEPPRIRNYPPRPKR